MRGRGQAGCAVHYCTMSARESSRRMEAVRLMDMARRGGEEERGDAPPSYAVQEEVPEPELDGTCGSSKITASSAGRPITERKHVTCYQ